MYFGDYQHYKVRYHQKTNEKLNSIAIPQILLNDGSKVPAYLHNLVNRGDNVD